MKSKDEAIVFVINNHYSLKSKNVIAHVRASTGTNISDDNAHPFMSSKNRERAIASALSSFLASMIYIKFIISNVTLNFGI